MKRGTPDHPKTLALMQQLEVSRITAVGILELLWHFTADYAKRGDIGRYTDEQIARGLGWEGSAEGLVAALVAAGWLDQHRRHRLVVHDWPEHADDAVHRALARAKTRFADGTIPKLTRLSTKERTEIEAWFRAHKRRTRGALPEPEPRQGQSQSPAPPEPRQGPAPESERASPASTPAASPRETWLTPYGEAWQRRWGPESEPPWREMAGVFGRGPRKGQPSPHERHGAQLVVWWSRFLAAQERAEWARPARFLQGLGQWTGSARDGPRAQTVGNRTLAEAERFLGGGDE